jgi:large subunit ribosomal protein L13
MATPFPKGGKNDRKWFLVNVAGKPLGRAASQVASILKGKNNVMYVPYSDMGDHVIVINAAQIKLTGKKLEQKSKFRHSGWPEGDRFTPYKVMIEKNPERMFTLAIKGMLPKNTLGREMIKKLKVYRDDKHNHVAQKPQVLEINI